MPDAELSASNEYVPAICPECRILQIRVSALEIRVSALETTISALKAALLPLGSRQLIEAGRKLYWDEYGVQYGTAHPDRVNSEKHFDYDLQEHILDTAPTQWGHFISFAEKRNREGTFWRILAGGRSSEFARMSENVHHADSYKIASESGEMAPEYHELFVKVFKRTVTEAIAKGP